VRTNSHLPNRRLLGDVRTPRPFRLDTAEVIAFLARHPNIRTRVETFERQVAAGGYIQGSSQYEIPSYGIAVPDQQLLNVTIFPNAHGQLLYSGNVPDDVAAQIELPPFESPRGDDDPLSQLLALAPWVVGGIVGLLLLNTFRSRS